MSKCFQLTRLIFCVFKYWPDFRQRSKQMYIPDVTLLRTGAFKRINSQCQHKKVHYLPKPTQYPYKYVFIYLLSSINYCLHYFPIQTDHPYSIVNQVNQKSAVLPASVNSAFHNPHFLQSCMYHNCILKLLHSRTFLLTWTKFTKPKTVACTHSNDIGTSYIYKC